MHCCGFLWNKLVIQENLCCLMAKIEEKSFFPRMPLRRSGRILFLRVYARAEKLNNLQKFIELCVRSIFRESKHLKEATEKRRLFQVTL